MLESKIVSIKLVSGEEIIANLIDKQEKAIFVASPLRYFFVMNGSDASGGLIPWFISSDEQYYTINSNTIVAMGLASGPIVQLYNRTLNGTRDAQQEKPQAEEHASAAPSKDGWLN